MSLLDKFSTVEIKADNRISEEDREFCMRQQEAFDKAGPALQKISQVIASARAEQMDILGTEENTPYMLYLVSRRFHCDVDGVTDAMKDRNETFIETIVRYFSQKYKVELSDREIMEHIIPSAPKEPALPYGGYRNMDEAERDGYKEKLATYKKQYDEYQRSLQSLPLRYEQIVDEIFVQLGGYSFREQAMNEFLERTWDCCHKKYGDKGEEFEIKNDTLRLTGNWVSVDENKWMTHPVLEYQSADKLKTLLDALAYYECGRMDEGYLWFPELFNRKTKENQFETFNMSKIKSVKLFKNGRVDIKFRNASYVQEFAAQYLRRRAA